MKTIVLREAGYDEAMLGLSLSYNQDVKNMPKVARKLTKRGGSHEKFLESIAIWLDVTAPRYWWSQFDTYRIGVTKQSESTMHTILNRPLGKEDFEHSDIYAPHLKSLNTLIARGDFDSVKRHLPEAFLQRRIVCTNYKAMKNIYKQRIDHKLREWQEFLMDVVLCLEHPEFIVQKEGV